jgi:hypothetical protein
MRRAGVVLGALMLGGRSIAAKIDARTEYQKSVADYRACLDAHPWELKACDGKRLAMEAEDGKYEQSPTNPRLKRARDANLILPLQGIRNTNTNQNNSILR